MDVRRLLVFSSISFFIAACGSSGGNDGSFNKSGSVECANAAIANQKIVFWKNGSISRMTVQKNNGTALMATFVEKNQKDILFIEDDYKIKLAPMDFAAQGWGGSDSWGTDYVHASALWNKDIKGQGITVAIVDSGIDTGHPQLNDQLYENPNEVANGEDDDGNGLIDDIHGYDFIGEDGDLDDSTGHGTHVAGIIAAEHGSGNIRGIAPSSKLLVYDFFSANGDGSVSDAIKAIRYAAEAGAKVINASWGGPGCSQSLNKVISELENQNILFVSAAGNDGQNIAIVPSYPAAFVSTAQIAVGAMTVDEKTARFSNFGNPVHIVAPGTNIVSTYPNNSTRSMNGTSMAAPFVTGAVALLWSAFPNATALEIKMALMSSARPGPYPVSSGGALDVEAAYDYLHEHLP